MKIKRFNEEAGFDDEDLRARFEIPNLMGEFDKKLSTYSKPVSEETTKTFIKKVLYRYPVLDRFHLNIQNLDSIEAYNLYATSLEPKEGVEFYAQLSLAFNKGDYYCLAILRGLEDADDEDKWYTKDITVDSLDETFVFVDAFLKACKGLNIVGKSHLEEDRFRNN
jgi:hypothetical protein